MSVKIVRNISKVEQYTIHDGARHVVPPLATVPVLAEIADRLIDECSPHIQLQGGVNTLDDPEWGGERMWLFNATGDPDVPKTVTVRRIVNRRNEDVEIDNPLAKPKVVSRKYHRGQKPGKDRAGQDCWIPLGSSIKEMWPYTRVSFPKPVADWMLSQDSYLEVSGEIKRAREPSSFEPNKDWDYDDLRVYAGIIDSKINPGMSREEIKTKTARGRKYRGMREEAVLATEKDVLWRRIFFRISIPLYRIPTREEFDLIRAEVLGLNKESEEEEEPPTPKRRGRPPKKSAEQPAA
jgi:hypothetical protein